MNKPVKVREKKETITLIPHLDLMDIYMEGDQLEKKGKAMKDSVKEELREWLKGNYTPTMYVSKDRDRAKRDPVLIYEWLKTLEHIPPDLLESLVIKTIPDSSLDILYEDRLIKVEDIPESCYSITIGATKINIPENRKRKK